MERALEGLYSVGEHPADDDHVVGHQDDAGGAAHPADQVRRRRLAPGVLPDAHDGRALDLAPQADLCGEEGEADQDADQHVDEQERAAAVGPCQIGETPDVSEADGEPRRREDEADAAAPSFTLLSSLFRHGKTTFR